MLIKETVNKDIEEVKDVVCNLCSASCLYAIGEDVKIFNYALIKSSFGYGSVLDNEYNHTKDKHICDQCYINLFPLNEEED